MRITGLTKCFAWLTLCVPGIASALAGVAAEPPFRDSPRQIEACTGSTHAIRQLAMIDHTSDGGFQCIGVSVEGDTVKSIRLERHSFSSSGVAKVEHIKVAEFPTTSVDSPRGVVVDGIPGHDAIVLRGHLSHRPGKEDLEIFFLYNGLTGEYRSCRIAVDRVPNAGWRLVNRLDQPFSLIMVRVRQLPVIGVVGIDNLEGACT